MAPGKKGIGKRDRQLLSFWATIRSAETTMWNAPNKSRDWSFEPYQLLENLMPFPWHPHSTVMNWQPTDLDSFLFCLSLQPSPDPHSQFGTGMTKARWHYRQSSRQTCRCQWVFTAGNVMMQECCYCQWRQQVTGFGDAAYMPTVSIISYTLFCSCK